MLYPRNQNWRTSLKPYTLSLANAVNTGVSYSTPSGTVPNQKAWASAGFRGFGPTHTYTGAGMDGMGCGCGCNGGGNGGGNGFLLYALAGAGLYFLVNAFMARQSSYGE